MRQTQTLPSGTQWQYKIEWMQLQIQEIPFKHKKILFYCQGNKTLEHPAQKYFGVSSSGDTQNPTGQSTEVLSSLRYFAVVTQAITKYLLQYFFIFFFRKISNRTQTTILYEIKDTPTTRETTFYPQKEVSETNFSQSKSEMCLFLQYKEGKDRLFHEKLQMKRENKKDFMLSLATKLTFQTICMSAEL